MKPNMHHLYTLIWLRNQEEKRKNKDMALSSTNSKSIEKNKKETIKENVKDKKENKNYSADDVERFLLIM